MKLPKPTTRYPHQIWLLFWGNLIAMAGQSLVWPFLTIYIRQQLDAPLSQITPLFTLQSITSVVAAGLLGSAMDRFGRKWAMVVGPLAASVTLIAMGGADTLALWAVLLSLYAITTTAFRIGSHAMVADFVGPERRAGAYALLRMAANVGIAVGPAIGGFLVAISYTLSYFIAAAVQVIIALYALARLQETLPADEDPAQPRRRTIGYGPLLHDRPFLTLWGVYLLIEMAASIVFVLLAVYIKEQFAIPENQFGFILATNATMVVLFQYGVTRITQRHPPLVVMALSGLFYAGGLGIFAIGQDFFTFWLGMVVLTIGELMLAPTATAAVAHLAPADMRARYMGIYGLSYRVGSGVGPVVGGLLADAIAPAAPWYGGMLVALAASVGFLLMARSRRFQAIQAEATRSA